MALIKKVSNYKFCYDTIDEIKIIQMNYYKIVIYCNELLLQGQKHCISHLGQCVCTDWNDSTSYLRNRNSKPINIDEVMG